MALTKPTGKEESYANTARLSAICSKLRGNAKLHMTPKGCVILEQSKTAYVTKEEQAALKDDLLHFVHAVSYGDLSEPEHIKALAPVFEIIVKFFS